MKKLLLLLALPVALLAQPTTPLANTRFSGTNNVVLDSASIKFGTTTPGSISGSSGALAITAAGTNQSITLTTSGTGQTIMDSASGSSSAGVARRLVSATNTLNGVFDIELRSSGTPIAGFGPSFNFVGQSSTTQGRTMAFLASLWTTATDATRSAALTFNTVNSGSLGERARISASGNLLLGGLTTDGTGVLQFPSATTSAGGIAFGGIYLYRSASGTVTLQPSSGSAYFTLNGDTQESWYQVTNSAVTTGQRSWRFGTASSAGGSFTSNAFGLQRMNDALSSITDTVFDMVPGTFRVGSAYALKLDNALIGTPDSRSGAGAVSVATLTTALTSTGVGEAITLANGSNGQIKTIVHDVDGGSMVLTPTTKTGFSTVTFTNAGDTVTLQYFTTRGWMVLASYGATVAP